MKDMESQVSNAADRSLQVQRILNAPVDLVWEVFTKPEHIVNWWGPNGFTNTIYTMDVRVGGEWDFMMHGPDGQDFKNRSIYQEIVPFKRIVFNHFAPNFTATIEFEEKGDQTGISWHMLFESAEVFMAIVKAHKADKGLEENIVKLDAYLQVLKHKN